jgi:hypothetical protein
MLASRVAIVGAVCRASERLCSVVHREWRTVSVIALGGPVAHVRRDVSANKTVVALPAVYASGGPLRTVERARGSGCSQGLLLKTATGVLRRCSCTIVLRGTVLSRYLRSRFICGHAK